MDLAPKPASASRTIQTQILLSQHINGSGRLFGGQLMQMRGKEAAAARPTQSGQHLGRNRGALKGAG